MGRGQQATHKAITRMRERTPFEWKAMHSEGDTAFINGQLERYAKAQGIKFSRSRPFKKNDNCFVEQKNSTHIRAILGHLRYDTDKEQKIINSLYRKSFGSTRTSSSR